MSARPVIAQSIRVTSADLNLRPQPTTASQAVSVIPKGDTVRVIPGPDSIRSGYYHVMRANGDSGWAYSHYLHAPTTAVAENVTTTTTVPSSAISPSWDKKDPNHVPMPKEDTASKVCAWSGQPGNTETIVAGLKNRADTPAVYHAVTWDALAHLPWPRGATTHRQPSADGTPGWTQAQLDSIAPYEREALIVTGFVAKIRKQSSNQEATNCKWNGELNTDWHIEFVGNFSNGQAQSEKEAVVVETTPRFKRVHPKWANFEQFANPAHSTDSVRVSGWLMLDPEHKAHLGLYRQTLWEIHPITRLEVFQNGKWVDLDSLP